VTLRVTILSEGATGETARFTPVKEGQLRRPMDVSNKMVSGLSLLSANQL